MLGSGSLVTARTGRVRKVGSALLMVVMATACLDETNAGDRSLAITDDTTESAAAVMPDVICMDLQAAQDLIQESGVFFSKSVDATGQGRMQIMDRNWVVVDQTPAAGEPIGEGDAELAVVKDDEPSACDGGAEELAAPASPATTPAPAPDTTAPATTSSTTAAPTTTLPPTTTFPPTTTTVPAPPPPPPTAAVQPFFPEPACDPNYTGDCVPIASDVDCASGEGNGPAYVRGPVQIIGRDIYDLDGNDNDGIGCES